jgi:hypothetical protein
MKTYRNGSTAMNLMHEELARAQMSARLGEAQELRRGHHLLMARRMSRKAEQAAQLARLALARAL